MKLPHLLLAALLTLLAPLAHGADFFTLAVVPDVQQETSSPRFNGRLQWLIDERSTLNLAAVLQVGDLQNWDTPDHEQFVHQSAGLALLDRAQIPYVTCLGNHDTAAVKVGGSAAPGNVNANLRKTAVYNNYYPPTRFSLLRGVFEKDKIDNAWHTFAAGDLDWLVLNLELWPRTEVVAWAKTVVTAHRQHNVVILTHSFLNGRGEIEQSKGGYGDNSPQYLFEQVIQPHANVRLVCCGHVGSPAHREDKTAAGTIVHSFLQCYHDGTTNPVRILEINPKEGTLKSRVYCPSIEQDKKDDSTFTLRGLTWVPRAATATPRAPSP